MRIGILKVVCASAVFLFSTQAILSAEPVVSNEDLVVSVDSSSLPQWQQDEMRSYEISARVVFRTELKELDALLYSDQASASPEQQRDVYIVVGIRMKYAPRTRLLVLRGEFQKPERLMAMKFEFRDVNFRKDGRDIAVMKLGDHDEGQPSKVLANKEKKVVKITSCMMK